MQRTVALLSLSLCAAEAMAQEFRLPPANLELLRSARHWEARQRGDLARLALEKLVASRPDSPEVLRELGELNLRMNDVAAAARVLHDLETRFKATPAAESFALEYRFATSDRLALATVRRYIDTKQYAAALAELQRLFPGGAPRDALGLEYYGLLARMPGQYGHADAGLKRLTAEHPGDPRYAAKSPGQRQNSSLARIERPAAPAATATATATATERAEDWERRAQTEQAAGNDRGAAEDYAKALALAPGNPWTRYRLAKLQASRRALDEGIQLAPNDPDMRFARALYLASIGDDTAALADVDAIPNGQRSDGMTDLRDRVEINLARAASRRAAQAGDHEGARAALLAMEPLATHRLERAMQLAYAWADLGDFDHAMALIAPYQREAPQDKDALLAWAEMSSRCDRFTELASSVEQLRARADLTPDDRQSLAKWQRTLRILRADAEFAAGRVRLARDEYARLIAEQPEDLSTRLSYVRSLTDIGDLELARAQLRIVQGQADGAPMYIKLGIARRQLALGDAAGALQTVQGLFAGDSRVEALLLAGRAELSLRHFAAARRYFIEAATGARGDEAQRAEGLVADIDARMQSGLTAGLVSSHKPGDSGVSRFDLVAVPTTWRYARNYEQRLTAHADWVSIDAGVLGPDHDIASLVGTVQAAGPAAPRIVTNGRQNGVGLGAEFATERLRLDIGTTPLGFELSSIVGGAEWRPNLRALDVTLGLARRAVTSSVLSYAGLRDPITGRSWGGVVASGPYLDVGLYRARYSLAGSLRVSELSGTHVQSNHFLGLRLSGDRKVLSRDADGLYVGLVVNYWKYQHNLENYTYGSGGYYSPQSYVSIALPVEIQGARADWSYRARVAIAHSKTDIDRVAFYPIDPALQAAAVNSPLPPGDSEPYFAARHSGGNSVSADAAVERRITAGLVLGGAINLDRSDYYHPTTLTLFFRHDFKPRLTPLAKPPRRIRPYSEE